jgi:hypothetical protein
MFGSKDKNDHLTSTNGNVTKYNNNYHKLIDNFSGNLNETGGEYDEEEQYNNEYNLNNFIKSLNH